MADNLSFVGKWMPVETDEAVAQEEEKQYLQFYKDGSCLIPAYMLGKGEKGDTHMFYFYQVFENGMMRLESELPGSSLYHCALVGDMVTLTSLSGDAFAFIKEKVEKRSFFKSKITDVVSNAAREREPEPEREPEDYEWKCPNCGKINQNYVGTCGCGAPKPHEKQYIWTEVHPELIKPEEPAEEEQPKPEKEKKEKPKKVNTPPEREPEAHEWKCPNCGVINQNYVGTCGCGAPKPHEKQYIWSEVHPELLKKDEPEEEEAPAVEEETKKKPKKEEKKEPERVPTEHEWKCSSCGKINQNYVGTCGCGAPKPHEKQYIWSEVHPELLKKDEPEEAETPAVEAVSKKKTKKEVKKEEKEPERVPTENEWKCPKCGKINQNYVGTCGCGEGKP